MKQEVLGVGIEGCALVAEPFKTSRVSVTAYLPLEEDTVAAYSMLAMLLSNGCAMYPQPRDLTCRMEELYGMSVSFDCDKSGDKLMLMASCTFADDAFLPEPVFAQAVGLLREMLFRPALDEGGFLEANFKREQRMQLEYIRAKINDKRDFARDRCASLTCAGEPFALSETGTAEQAQALTRGEAAHAWKTMLETARFRIAVIAPTERPEVFAAFRDEFAAIDRSGFQPLAPSVSRPAKATPQTVEEHFPVAQGKLVMGFRFAMSSSKEDMATLLMFRDLFGGSPHSRLFVNVREKQSLCYYCTASPNRGKRLLLVDAGVEFDKMKQTETAVLHELQAMCDGAFTDEDMTASRLAIAGVLRGIRDSQAAMDRWYADRWSEGMLLSPEDVAELVARVTREDILRLAKTVQLDTVYRLLGKEDAQ